MESGHRILVVDDAPAVLFQFRAIAAWLRLPDPVHEVTTVAAALARVRSEPPTLAFVDLVLPDGSGVDVIEAISRAAPGAVIHAMTGLVEGDPRVAAAMRAGARGYVGKPLRAVDVARAYAAARATP